MKRFLKRSGGVDTYENVRIEWIRGTNPELTIFDARGAVVDKKSLDRYKYTALHELFGGMFPKKSGAAASRMLSERAPTPAALDPCALSHEAGARNPTGRAPADPSGAAGL